MSHGAPPGRKLGRAAANSNQTLDGSRREELQIITVISSAVGGVVGARRAENFSGGYLRLMQRNKAEQHH
jgi:hypothetical protein